MDFDYSPNQERSRGRIKAVRDEMAALKLEREDVSGMRDALLNGLRTLAEAGYLSYGLEDARNSVELLAVREVLAAAAPSLFLAVEVSARVFGRLVAVYGTADQKEEILPALKEGRLIGGMGLGETGMSIENNPFQTKSAEETGGFRVTGDKCHIVNGPVADLVAVAAEREGRLVFFLVDRSSAGLSVGKRLYTLGYAGVAISPLSLRGCFVPSRSAVGPFTGQEVLGNVRSWEDEILISASLGLMQNAFDTASQYAKVHRSGGRPIMAYQEVAFKIAEMLTLLQTARLLAYRAAWMSETGDKESAVLARCSKVFCTESAEKATSSALQILGQGGFVRGNPAEEGFRDAKYLQIAGTSTEISRVKIGDALLATL
jgi:alkylation response protein AidB-like acyl-CoA dehydrogenase